MQVSGAGNASNLPVGQEETGKKRRAFLIALAALPFLIAFLILGTTKRCSSAEGSNKNTDAKHLLFSNETITPLTGTLSQHLLVSAFVDRRVEGWDVRIIGIFRTDAIAPLHCVFSRGDNLCVHGSTPASLVHHLDTGFPFETRFAMCQMSSGCEDATHVTLSTHPDGVEAHRQIFLPIRNLEKMATMTKEFDLTVCIPALYGEYNNVLQFAQALEMYRILGVGRVVIYDTSHGADLGRLLRSYVQEGFVEFVPWPIDKHVVPSRGNTYRGFGVAGDLHYYGQLATLNDCMYRYMERSRYMAVHDIDEIIVPRRHHNLPALMEQLRREHPEAAAFRFQMDHFPAQHVDPNATFRLPQWERVPGINILENIYRWDWLDMPPIARGYKQILQPMMVEQTGVHEVLKAFGGTVTVPEDTARIVHVRSCIWSHNPRSPIWNPSCMNKERMHVDKELWRFHEKLVPNVDKALRRAGMLRETNYSTAAVN